MVKIQDTGENHHPHLCWEIFQATQQIQVASTEARDRIDHLVPPTSQWSTIPKVYFIVFYAALF